jgi:tetratricopeptide (TPR) repeat protein
VDAEIAARETLALFGKYLDADDVRNSFADTLAGAALRQQGRLEEADTFLRIAQRLVERWGGPGTWMLAPTLIERGLVRSAEGRLDEAEPLLARASDVSRETSLTESRAKARALAALAGVLHARGRAAEALAACGRALAIRERSFPPGAAELEETRSAYIELSRLAHPWPARLLP